MAKSQERAAPQHPDLLAAVVLHTLVSAGTTGLTAAQVAPACERDPDDPSEADEIAAALAILVRDELALRADEVYRPTRAAIRAAELSF
ncbi:MAG TPA: hypothetical protein VGY30_13210 [Solirubrobacteraceae bacterium]|nr:hypothetical protein [Solirubrobacteraceae bacterium]